MLPPRPMLRWRVSRLTDAMPQRPGLESCHTAAMRAFVGWALAAMTLGCGPSQAHQALHHPLMVKCENAALTQCRTVADGLVLHVEGQRKKAARMLREVANANSEAALTAFIDSLGGLRSTKSAAPYLDKLRRAADAMMPTHGSAPPPVPKVAPVFGSTEPDRADGSEPRRPSARKAPASLGVRIGGRALTPDTDAGQLTSLTTVLVTEGSKPCGSLTAGDARCVTLVDGPFVVTDLASTGSCKTFVAIGEIEGDHGAPMWLEREPLSQFGVRVRIKNGDGLFVGFEESKLPCTLTWSGFRPY